MTLVRTGQGVTDIRGGFGGVYFTRDKSGLHMSRKPRNISRLTEAQRKQRNAFIKARRYTKDPRWVSYYIYLALNNIPFPFDAIVTGELDPNSAGTYELAGTYKDKDYYERKDSNWFIWWNGYDSWVITEVLGVPIGFLWQRLAPDICGIYIPKGGASGIATVTLSLRPPPADYQIPKL